MHSSHRYEFLPFPIRSAFFPLILASVRPCSQLTSFSLQDRGQGDLRATDLRRPQKNKNTNSSLKRLFNVDDVDQNNSNNSTNCNANGAKSDCGFAGITPEQCVSKGTESWSSLYLQSSINTINNNCYLMISAITGCCWDPTSSNLNGGSGTPWCFFRNQAYQTYALQNFHSTPNGFQGQLIQTTNTNLYGGDITPLQLLVFLETDVSIQ